MTTRSTAADGSGPGPVQPSIGGYRLIERLGAGGTGTVYRCHPLARPDEALALKLLHRPVSDPVAHAAFARERDLLRRLSGLPGVVSIVDAGVEADGRAWLVSELLSGDCAERVRSLGRLPWREVANVGGQLATALAHAHALGVVHGDIKPGNVFLSNAGFAVLGDFGAGVDPESTLDAREPGLSIAYAAPETLAGEPPSPASDLFSLGATLHHLASGRVPLQGLAEAGERLTPAGALVLRHRHPEPPPLDGSVPEALAALIRSLTAVRADARPSGAKGVARQLQAMARHDVTGDDVARARAPDEPGPAPGRAAGRRSGLSLAFACACIAVAGLAFAAVTAWRDASFASGIATASGASLPCVPGASLCESFEDGFGHWGALVDPEVATFDTVPDGAGGRALEWRPSRVPFDVDERRGSYLYRTFAAPAADVPLRVRVRARIEPPDPTRFWMTLVQLSSSEGHTWSLDIQQPDAGELGFDTFFYDPAGVHDVAAFASGGHPFDEWLCIEMIVDPRGDSLLTLHVDGRPAGDLDRAPIRLDVPSYSLTIGSTHVETPLAAPRVLLDDVAVDTVAEPACV